jgi:hypothetical protein
LKRILAEGDNAEVEDHPRQALVLAGLAQGEHWARANPTAPQFKALPGNPYDGHTL